MIRKAIAVACVCLTVFLTACTGGTTPVSTVSTPELTTTTEVSNPSDNTTNPSTNSNTEPTNTDTESTTEASRHPYNSTTTTQSTVSQSPSTPTAEPTKPVSEETRDEVRPEGNTANLMNPIQGGSDEQAEAMRQKITDSVETYAISGTTYYISPNGDDSQDGTSPETAWKTLDMLTMLSFLFEEGDAVLFERGGIYRENSPLTLRSGVTYGAYGEGEKPVIYGSPMNYAEDGQWEPSNIEYVWKLALPRRDAGIVVFDHGESVGIKKDAVTKLNENGDFYHNTADGILYLYLDKGHPRRVYKSIEIGTNNHILQISSHAQNIVIDNLCLKYGGAHGIQGAGNNTNIRITNCEFGWIGGSLQNPTVRYGNAVEFWNSCENVTVDNCWVYQVYDAGLTFQGDAGSTYNNIQFTNNLIEYCSYSIEFFVKEDQGTLHDILLENNIMRFAGYGWGSQRPDPGAVAHITGWVHHYEDTENFVIRNNVFDCTNLYMVYWRWAEGEQQPGLTVSGNTFYQRSSDSGMAMHFGSNGQQAAKNQAELEQVVGVLDSAPKLVQWLG